MRGRGAQWQIHVGSWLGYNPCSNKRLPSQLLPMIFRISRNTRIQDAQPVTFFRSRSLFSCREITIRITKIIPCLVASPNICPFETCGRLLRATWTSGPGWRSLKGNPHWHSRPPQLYLCDCVCVFNPSISNAPRFFPLWQTVSTSVSVPSNY